MKRVIADISELRELAQDLLNEFPEGAVIALEGDLGAGKTTLVRQIVEILATQHKQTAPRVISPTFVIHQRYQFEKITLDHFDLYRMIEVDESAATEIGLVEAVMNREKGFVFVEWRSRLTKNAGIHFDRTVSIEIEPDGKRIVDIYSHH